jgi:hypothetical protein
MLATATTATSVSPYTLSTSVAPQPLSFADMISAVELLVQTNATYLAIAVTFIGIVVGLVYFFSLQPIQGKIREQEKELKSLQEKVQVSISASEEERHKWKESGVTLADLVELFIALDIVM